MKIRRPPLVIPSLAAGAKSASKGVTSGGRKRDRLLSRHSSSPDRKRQVGKGALEKVQKVRFSSSSPLVTPVSSRLCGSAANSRPESRAKETQKRLLHVPCPPHKAVKKATWSSSSACNSFASCWRQVS